MIRGDRERGSDIPQQCREIALGARRGVPGAVPIDGKAGSCARMKCDGAVMAVESATP